MINSCIKMINCYAAIWFLANCFINQSSYIVVELKPRKRQYALIVKL